MTVFYYFGLFLCGSASTFSMQKYGRSNRTYQSISVYALVTGIMAMGIFWAMSGFTLELSAVSILYATVYAALALLSYFTNLPAYRYLVIVMVSLLSLPLFCRGHIGVCVSEFRSIAPMQYLMILVGTVASNVSSLLGVLILAADAFTLFVPLSGALGILSTEAVAVFAVRERPRILPVTPACGAMLLSFFK